MWVDDLAVGKRAEVMVSLVLEARGNKVEDVSNIYEYQRQDIDFIVANSIKSTTLEVKNDVKSVRTGNLFIETYNENNFSRNYQGWFYYCCADYLAFVQEVKKEIHIISRADLIELCKNLNEKNFGSIGGFLLPLARVKQAKSYQLLRGV